MGLIECMHLFYIVPTNKGHPPDFIATFTLPIINHTYREYNQDVIEDGVNSVNHLKICARAIGSFVF